MAGECCIRRRSLLGELAVVPTGANECAARPRSTDSIERSATCARTAFDRSTFRAGNATTALS
jgi:hypothetical protein